MLNDILGTFAANIRARVAEGFLGPEWVTDGFWIEQRWLHGALWGALTMSAPAGTMALVEPGIRRDFRPDLAFINPRHEKIAVIEYESSNSSDERLIVKDLWHYRTEIESYKGFEQHSGDPEWVLPKLWLIISTLPSCEVANWPWHGYNKQRECGPVIKDRNLRNANPLAYYEDSLHKAFADAWKGITSSLPMIEKHGVQLVWANVNQTDIRVMNVNGQPQGDNTTAFVLFPESR
ncbi:hypothetical protein [Novispirillum itersonii]|uniref:hypothetical protein n=1 Tax=Novispirillum itersonii TaxID=189 RepID=UPI0003762323|nr:hypothetical protein [Novispirillum itersonii]